LSNIVFLKIIKFHPSINYFPTISEIIISGKNFSVKIISEAIETVLEIN